MFQQDGLGQSNNAKGFEVIVSEHPEVKVLWEKRFELGDKIQINGINPILHVMLEGMVENQINDPGFQEVREAVEKLEEKGLTRHAARATIAEILTSHFFNVLKTQQPFDKPKYIGQVRILGEGINNVNRNEPCPCGSEVKFKKCCYPVMSEFKVASQTGRLVLGQGHFITGDDFQRIMHPLDPIYQLENRVHIANFLTANQDLNGAVKVLDENINAAQTYKDGIWRREALFNMLDFCITHNSFHDKGVEVIDKLLSAPKNDVEKGLLICHKADFKALLGQDEEADELYNQVMEDMPDWHFGRYRYAVHLNETDRREGAKTVLYDLLAAKDKIDSQTYKAAKEALENLFKVTEETD